jgi:hypothetical protein
LTLFPMLGTTNLERHSRDFRATWWMRWCGGGFQSPTDVTIADDGRIFVVEKGRRAGACS